MKYLRILLSSPRIVIVYALIFATMLGFAAPAYADTASNSTLITCTGGPMFSGTTSDSHNGSGETCFVRQYIDPAVRVLAALVAVFVVLSIVIAGIQYSSAADDSSKVAAAKGRIQKALIALLAYLFLLAFVQYILPGGIGT